MVWPVRARPRVPFLAPTRAQRSSPFVGRLLRAGFHRAPSWRGNRCGLIFLIAVAVFAAETSSGEEGTDSSPGQTSAPVTPASASANGEREALRAAPIWVRAQGEAGRVFEEGAVETQVIPVEQIETTASQTIADVVRRVPGFRVQQRIQGEDAVVSIEGLPPEYTKILVNGQRYTGRLGEVDDLADLPITCVDRVELLRGTQGVRYGTDAGGGVINVVTRRPPDEGGNVQLEGGGGDDGQGLASLALSQRLGPVGATVCYTHRQIDGYDPPTDVDGVFVNIGGKDSQSLTDDVYTTFNLPLGDDLLLFANLGYRSEDEGFITPAGDDIGDLDFGRALAHAGAQWQISDAADWRSEAIYYRGVTENDIVRDFTLREDQIRVNSSASFYYAFDAFETPYFEVDAIETLLVGGIDVRHPRLMLREGQLDFQVASGESTISSNQNVDEQFTSAGLFAQGEVSLATWIQLVLGLRLETHTEFDPELLPQVALRVNPVDWLAIRAQWGQNYRTPSLRDLYRPDTQQNNYILGGNPDLQPEFSNSYRLGFEVDPDPRISFAAVGFWNSIDDFIRALPDEDEIQVGENVLPGNPNNQVCQLIPDFPGCMDQVSPVFAEIFRPQNLDFVRTRGVEVLLNASPWPFLDLRLGYTFTDTKVESQRIPALRELPNEPRNTVDLAATIRTPLPWLDWPGPEFGINARWRGKALTEVSGTGFGLFTSLEESKPSWQVDLRMTQQVTDELQLYFDVYNATDTRIVDSYVIRGRHFFGGLRYRANWDSTPWDGSLWSGNRRE